MADLSSRQCFITQLWWVSDEKDEWNIFTNCLNVQSCSYLRSLMRPDRKHTSLLDTVVTSEVREAKTNTGFSFPPVDWKSFTCHHFARSSCYGKFPRSRESAGWVFLLKAARHRADRFPSTCCARLTCCHGSSSSSPPNAAETLFLKKLDVTVLGGSCVVLKSTRVVWV